MRLKAQALCLVLFISTICFPTAAKRIGINNIVTHDNDFARLTTVTIWGPGDI